MSDRYISVKFLEEMMRRHRPLDGADRTKERRAFMEWLGIYHAIKDAPTIEAVYLCNRKRCDRCNPECDFTRDIDYAATTDKVIVVDGAAYAVKGKLAGCWIPNPFDPEWDYCTACGQGTKRREYGTDDGREWVREYGYSFCPNCGAKMSNASNASNTLETLEKGETE